MDIIVKYDEKSIFGTVAHREDTALFADLDHAKKAIAFIRKKYDAAVSAGEVSVFWDSIADYENDIITVRRYDSCNYCSYDEQKKSYAAAKKEFLAMFK